MSDERAIRPDRSPTTTDAARSAISALSAPIAHRTGSRLYGDPAGDAQEHVDVAPQGFILDPLARTLADEIGHSQYRQRRDSGDRGDRVEHRRLHLDGEVPRPTPPPDRRRVQLVVDRRGHVGELRAQLDEPVAGGEPGEQVTGFLVERRKLPVGVGDLLVSVVGSAGQVLPKLVQAEQFGGWVEVGRGGDGHQVLADARQTVLCVLRRCIGCTGSGERRVKCGQALTEHVGALGCFLECGLGVVGIAAAAFDE